MTVHMTRWSPLGELASLEVDRLNRMFEAAFSQDAAASAWVPATDIRETSSQELVIKADLPALKKEDIKVTFENNVLTIEGERKMEDGASGDSFHRLERAYGAFRRSFTLPSSVDSSRVSASYQDGVLTITLPRKEETKPRQIDIKG